ncbi:MAG: hypothetical protein O2910_03945, partial [Proteobacteria bacterium]|nr:hypothetical protein [Pseudomonadota bacterium]
WLLYNRVWLAGSVVLGLFIALSMAPSMFDLPPLLAVGLRFVLHLTVGFFAFDLLRAALERRGYQFKDVAAGGSKEEAELRYYARYEHSRPAETAFQPETQIVTA